MTEYLVILRVGQSIEAESPEEAERLARLYLDRASDMLWWPSVYDGACVEVIE